MSVFNIFQTIGFYGFNNWVPSLLVKQGITISTSLGYTTVIALAAPVGPLIGFFLGDRFERKWIIVGAAGSILVCGLIFGQAREAALIIAMGVALTLAANIMSFSFHAYQQELFPTGIRARAAGFVYSWSRLSVIFSSFIIAFILEGFGAFGVFVFIAAAMAIVMATIGFFGPRTTNLALEKICGLETTQAGVVPPRDRIRHEFRSMSCCPHRTWPDENQEALAEAAREIEACAPALTMSPAEIGGGRRIAAVDRGQSTMMRQSRVMETRGARPSALDGTSGRPRRNHQLP